MTDVTTVRGVLDELANLYQRVDAGDMTSEERGELGMRITILKAIVDTHKTGEQEAQISEIKQRLADLLAKAPHLRRVV